MCKDKLNEVARVLWVSNLEAGRSCSLPVISGSMAPLLNIGETVGFRKPDRRPRPGDIVLFRKNGEFVCHRLIWWKSSRSFYQKGDLNSQLDQVDSCQVIGFPESLSTTHRTVQMRGKFFGFHNSTIWIMVLARDLAIWFADRRIPSANATAGALTRIINYQIRRLRGDGGRP